MGWMVLGRKPAFGSVSCCLRWMEVWGSVSVPGWAHCIGLSLRARTGARLEAPHANLAPAFGCTAEIQVARSWARKRERLLWGLPGLGRDGGEVAVVALCENCPGLLSKSWRFKRIRGETERKSHAATPKP